MQDSLLSPRRDPREAVLEMTGTTVQEELTVSLTGVDSLTWGAVASESIASAVQSACPTGPT